MGILLRKQKGVLTLSGIGKLSIIAFITSISMAIVNTIWAVYMESFLKSVVLVGIFSSILTIVALLSYIFSIPFIEKNNKSKIFFNSLILFFISYVLFAINTKFYLFVILAFAITVIQTLRITAFGIIIKDKSPKKILSRNEGLLYTFSNLAWLIGPLIAGIAMKNYSINSIFLLSAIFVLVSLLLFKISKINDPNINKKPDTNLIKNLKEFFKSEKRTIAYILGGGVNIWWTLIYLFIPLMIIDRGLNPSLIGYFLFLVAIPLILFEYHFSKLAGKIGFKKLMKIGYIIPCLISFICFFIPNIYVILSLLVLASIGMAMLEANTEAYFLDLLKPKEESRFYGPYNTTMEVSHFTAKIIPSLVLIIFPFRSIFIIFGLFMLGMFFLTFRMKDIIERKK
jgi:MFS family permease